MAMAALQDETTTTEIALPLRILLVEDDEFDVAVFRRAFRKSEIPCEIIRCSRAEDVIEGLRDAEMALDLLVSDHHLPGMSGLDLCLSLLKNRPPFALVLLTGGGSELVAIRALKAGVQEYIVKDSSRDYLEILPLVLRQVARRHRDRMARKRAESALRQSRTDAFQTLTYRLEGRLRQKLEKPLEDLVRIEGELSKGALANPPEELLAEMRAVLHHLQVLPGRLAELLRGPERVVSEGNEAPEGNISPQVGRLRVDSLNPPRVLVAHCNPVVAFVAARNVERLGLRYVPVENGLQALEALEREPFDVLLVELEMPSLDGYETARKVREREAARGGHLTILGLVVDPEGPEAVKCRQAGMDDVIPRPVSLSSLREALARSLDS
jgi:CheY-like chemotaxis protein